MKLRIRAASVSVAVSLLLCGGLALSSAGAASSNVHTHSDKSKITCTRGSGSYCFTVQNTGYGNALEGYASTGTALFGLSTGGTGVYGQSATSYGVYGDSIYSDGIYGYSADDSGVAVENDNTNYYALLANADAAGGYPLGAFGQGGEFTVDGGGNGYFSGSVTALDGFSTVIRSRGGEHVTAGLALVPRTTIEDSGTARLEGGEGVVRFDPAFARTIDFRSGYQVFLTPDGDTRGLYVASKYEGGFVVRETEHGRSSIYFDYRILAHPLGTNDARLPELHVIEPPRPQSHIRP